MIVDRNTEYDERPNDADLLRADAQRYRWLRENLNPLLFCQYMGYHPNDAVLWDKLQIDSAIDKAIKEKQ